MIDDPRVIKFANETLRPLSEIAEDFVASVVSMTPAWYGGLNVLIPNDGTVIDDGRESQGVSRLTGADIHNLMSILIAMSAASNSEILNKPTVRSPIVRR